MLLLSLGGPLPRTKIFLFLLSTWKEEVLSTPKSNDIFAPATVCPLKL